MFRPIKPDQHYVRLGRVNYLGQRMIQRVCHCGPVPRPVVYNSKPA